MSNFLKHLKVDQTHGKQQPLPCVGQTLDQGSLGTIYHEGETLAGLTDMSKSVPSDPSNAQGPGELCDLLTWISMFDFFLLH